MASTTISALPTGMPQGTDETPAVDVTDLSASPTGTDKKYIRSDEFNFVMDALNYPTLKAARVASTINLTVTYSNGTAGVGATLTNAAGMTALVLDGVTLALSDRVLIWNQVSAFQNGVYVVTSVGSSSSNWVLTRATDYNQASEILPSQIILVNQGTTYAGRAFQQNADGPFVIGTTDIVFQLFTFQQSTFNWNLITTTSHNMLPNNGYVTNNASLVTLILPLTSVFGDTINIVGYGAGGWVIQQNSGQSIQIGSHTSTVGGAGSVSSIIPSNSLQLVCIIDNTVWSIVGGPQGNLNVI